MKKIKLLLLLLTIFGTATFGQLQQIKIVSFTVKNQLPAVIDNWGNIPGSLLLVAQLPPTVRVKGISLVIQIRSGGAIVCSNNSAGGLPVDEFTTRTFSANELTGSLPGCHELKDGSYTICAQFFNIDRVAISNEVCKEFTVETPKATDYSPPTLINPENGKIYTEAEIQRPLMFRWTPVVPKPRETVTYRLRVWQLMQGQNGTTAMRTNQPIVTKDVDNITQAVVNGIYTGPCKPPIICEFIWQVQALNKEGKPIGRNEGYSEPYTFKVEETKATECSPPRLTSPEEGKKFTKKDMLAPVMFRWAAVVPKSQEPVTYRIKVWQLMQGQNGTQAMRSNKPIAEKDVINITEASVSNLYTGPCKPLYLCDFIWQVQALNQEGQPACTKNEGKSEPYTFKILDDNINTKIDSVKVGCCINGKQSIYVKVGNLHLTNQAQVTAIRYRVNGTGPLTTLSPVAPPLPFTINANSSQAFTGSINCVDSMKTIKFIVETIWPTDPDNINNETAWDTLKCPCTACDEKNFTLNAPAPGNITISNNTITFNQPITVTTIPGATVKTIKAELVYFEMVPENDMCIPCNKDAATYGHFTNGTNSMEWNKPIPQSVNINITTPQLTPCCSAVFKWCIRYKIEITDKDGNCFTCNKLVCYEKKKTGCSPVNPNNPNDPK